MPACTAQNVGRGGRGRLSDRERERHIARRLRTQQPSGGTRSTQHIAVVVLVPFASWSGYECDAARRQGAGKTNGRREFVSSVFEANRDV